MSGRHFIAMELVRGESLGAPARVGPVAGRGHLPHRSAARWSARGRARAGSHSPRRQAAQRLPDRARRRQAARFRSRRRRRPQPSRACTGLTLEADVTQEQRIVGTPSYMSPEQVLGRTLDGRSDPVLVGGGALMHGQSAAARSRRRRRSGVLEAVLGANPTAPATEINEKLPADVARVIERCLAKDPREALPGRGGAACGARSAVVRRVDQVAGYSSDQAAGPPHCRSRRRPGGGRCDGSVPFEIHRSRRRARVLDAGDRCPPVLEPDRRSAERLSRARPRCGTGHRTVRNRLAATVVASLAASDQPSGCDVGSPQGRQ